MTHIHVEFNTADAHFETDLWCGGRVQKLRANNLRQEHGFGSSTIQIADIYEHWMSPNGCMSDSYRPSPASRSASLTTAVITRSRTLGKDNDFNALTFVPCNVAIRLVQLIYLRLLYIDIHPSEMTDWLTYRVVLYEDIIRNTTACCICRYLIPPEVLVLTQYSTKHRESRCPV